MSCHFLLQGIFPTQESNLGLMHCRQILYRLSYKQSLVVYSSFKPDIERLKPKLLQRALFIYWEKNLIINYKVLKSSREPCTPTPSTKSPPCPLPLVYRKAEVSQSSPEIQKSRLKQLMIRTIKVQNLSVFDAHS